MRILKILGIFALFLLAARIALPYVLLRYAENRINQIPEYHVKIADLDVHLYRGSYTLKQVKLSKVKANIPVPYFSADAVDLSIEWKSLLHGALVGKVLISQPTINLVIDPQGKEQQLSINQEWQNAVKALFPLNLNLLKIDGGELNFQSFKAHPPFKLSLKNISLVVKNMQRVTDKSTSLSSSFSAAAQTSDGADVKLNGQFNPFAKEPTFKLETSLRHMQINQANNFLRHYTNVDVKQGDISLFVEAAAYQGTVKGYVKPIIKNLKIIDPQKDMGPVEALYKGALEIISKIVTNSDKQTIATKIKIQGKIEDPNTSTLSIIGYILRHAFIQALLPRVDKSITMQDVIAVNYPKGK